jgi:hypothetical protein
LQTSDEDDSMSSKNINKIISAEASKPSSKSSVRPEKFISIKESANVMTENAKSGKKSEISS